MRAFLIARGLLLAVFQSHSSVQGACVQGECTCVGVHGCPCVCKGAHVCGCVWVWLWQHMLGSSAPRLRSPGLPRTGLRLPMF